jgi:PTH1 family peptidyl-tRNA hydrolase
LRKAIIGLGNKGEDYHNTRHNIGWMLLDYLEKRLKFKYKPCSNFLQAKSNHNGCDLYFLKPMTFMNCSGHALKRFVEHEKIALANVLIICDDVELDFGQLRMRPRGGTGGHNGLRSISEELASEDFPRLRIGVGRGKGDLVEHVLGSFSKGEETELPHILGRASQAVLDFLVEEWSALMAKHNKKIKVMTLEEDK